MKYFERLHPICSFFYFIAVILAAMLTMNPAVVTVCFVSGIAFCGMLIGPHKLLASLAYTLPIMAIIAVTNPIFVHKGKTILFFMNDNPVTKESLIYGVFAAMMIASVFYWCRCYSEIMTSDKFIYLFGKAIPKLSLVISMTLAFIPRMRRKFREIDEAQKALGIYASESWADKIRGKMRVLSILLTNSLESGVDTADSMRARGYGLRNRSNYAIYRFTVSDALYLAFTIFCGILTAALIIIGTADFSYYPAISKLEISPLTLTLYIALVLLAGSSIFMEVKENILWRYLRSKI